MTDLHPMSNQPTEASGLSEQNRALLDRLIPDGEIRDAWLRFPLTLDLLLNAARAEGAALSQPETPGGGVTDQMVRAALESRARDDEGEFEPMMDLLGFSASNKARTAMRAALEAALGAKPAEPKPKLGVLDFTGRVVVPPFRTWYELTRRVPYPGYGTEAQFTVVSRVMEAVGEYVEMLSTESRR